MSLFPAWSLCAAYANVAELRAAISLPDTLWQAWTNQVGDPGTDIRLLAALPRVAVQSGCTFAQLADGSSLTPIQATQVGLVWRLARRCMAAKSGIPEAEFQDVDPWHENGASVSRGDPTVRGSAPTAPQLKEKVLKMNALIDQQDESELVPASNSTVNKWTQAYVTLMGSLPDRAEEPTTSQLSALAKRVIDLDGPPYVDMAVWVPFERRFAKLQKCRTYHPLGDGSYLVKDLPGPSSHQAWLASWRVFKCAALMLEVISLAALQAYERHVERLVQQWPGTWGLVYQADDRARAEQLERWRRYLTAEADARRQVPPTWNPSKPWSCILVKVVEDHAYWSETVHVPASAWTASGSKGKPVIASEASILNAIEGDKVAHGSRGDGDSEEKKRKSQMNRDKRLAKKKRFREEREELRHLRNNNSHGARQSNDHGKGQGKGKSKDQSGKAICFSWSSASGPCANVQPGGECLANVKRVHKCRLCLSPGHQEKDCPSK